ncbi:MAG: hypothetical protein ACR2PQ_08695 [Myxococcota bacterium]
MEWQGKPGSGAFQWNRGGWFGGQFGATAWMLVLGVLLLAQSRPVGAWVLLFGALPNALGFVLWSRRHSWAPFPALQTLIATCGLCAAAAWASVSQSDASVVTEGDFSAWVLLLYPGLLVWFFGMEHAARRANRRRDSTSAP